MNTFKSMLAIVGKFFKNMFEIVIGFVRGLLDKRCACEIDEMIVEGE